MVAAEKIILPLLDIKLGLMKQYVKALDIIRECFKYILHAFPGLSEEKKQTGIFNGPQIRQLLKDANFVSLMTSTSQQLSENFWKQKS